MLTGSITLAHHLLQARLVDELRLFTYPIVLGKGRRLFPEGWRAADLKLVETRTFLGGVTFSRYTL